MARMYPEHFPGAVEADNPEFEIFETLRSLPEKHTVFYSKKFKGGQRSQEECEIDFIVLGPDKYLLCLEVKGGLVEYRGGEESWYQNGKLMKKAPDRQSSAGMHALLDYLGEDAHKVNVGWGLCLPNCSLPKHCKSPSGVPTDVVIDEEKLLDATSAIKQVGDYYVNQHERPGFTGNQRQQVIDKLTRGIGFVQSAGVRVARDAKQLLEVTQEQFDALEDLMVNPRMVIKGYAGSGKTLLAQELAKRLDAQGKKVLLLFFNRMVANTVRYGIEKDSGIQCTTFHSLARELITAAEPDWWDSQSTKEDDFWNLTVPLKLFELDANQIEKYDAIIVDEGQDLKREWYEFLESLLAGKDSGNFVVFYDENQDIFDRWDDLPWGATDVPRKVLRKNCRNTKLIVDYINKKYSCEMESADNVPRGQQVIERKCSSVEDERKKLITDISRLLADGVEPGQIVILLNSPKADSCLADLSEVGSTAVEPMGRRYRKNSRAIQYSTIRMFKGLEAEVVFLVGLDNLPEEELAEAIYTQGSRAQSLLYVYRKKVGNKS